MIEDIEKLEPSFQLHALRDAGFLGEGHVEVCILRAVELIPPEIARRSHRIRLKSSRSLLDPDRTKSS